MSDRLLQDLALAALAAYNYDLDRAVALREPLANAGLLDPERVLGLDVGDLGNALKAAGYDRGGVTYIIAPRLQSLMAAARDGAIDRARDRLNAADPEGFGAAVREIKGFGPKAAELAWRIASGAG